MAQTQTFVSHSFQGWGIQDEGVGRLGIWWRPASWLTELVFCMCPYVAEGAGELWGLFYRGASPIHEGFTLRTQWPPRAPSPVIWLHWELGFQCMDFTGKYWVHCVPFMPIQENSAGMPQPHNFPWNRLTPFVSLYCHLLLILPPTAGYFTSHIFGEVRNSYLTCLAY